MGVAPHRVQLRRTKGWRMPPNTVKVDRTTKWGNPYCVEKQSGKRYNPAIRGFEEMWELRHPAWVRGDIFPTKETAIYMAVVRHACEVAPLLDLDELRGKNLACWCPLDKPCHADALLELANASVDGRRKAETENTGSVPKDDSAGRRHRPDTPSLQTPQGGDS